MYYLLPRSLRLGGLGLLLSHLDNGCEWCFEWVLRAHILTASCSIEDEMKVMPSSC
jgi:hypothetical protein